MINFEIGIKRSRIRDRQAQWRCGNVVTLCSIDAEHFDTALLSLRGNTIDELRKTFSDLFDRMEEEIRLEAKLDELEEETT